MRWFASGGKEGQEPGHNSFPATSATPSYAGFYVMRSDWTKQARYLVTHFGPTAGHGHPDYGSFLLSAYGADLVDEGGCASYGSEAYENYSRRPWSHNIVGIDGFTEEKNAGGFPLRGNPQYDWITNSAYDYTWGSYPFDGVNAALKGIAWDRAVYYAKPDYFVVFDKIRGEGTHKIRSKMQLSWNVSADVEGSSVLAKSEQGVSLDIAPFDNRPAPHIVRGQKEPFWDGWISKVPHSNLIEVAPSVVYEETRTLPVSYATLLYPSPAGKRPKVAVSETVLGEGPAAGVRLTVQAADRSFRDEFLVTGEREPVEVPALGLSANGQLVQLHYEKEGLKRVAFVKTSSISLRVGKKRTTIQFEGPSDGYLDVGAGGVFQRIYLDLSSRKETERVTIETVGGKPVGMNLPVGKESSLER